MALTQPSSCLNAETKQAKGSLPQLFQKADNWEFTICHKANALTTQDWIKQFFCAVSRAGDGIFWYVCMACMPIIYGDEGVILLLYMIISGLTCTLIYKQLKNRLVRERPFISFNVICPGTPPLDRYSFPSGHTMHAVCFTTVLFIFAPVIAVAVLPFTLLVMISRVILGLHYPSDVIIGAILGAMFAWGICTVIDLTFIANVL